MSEWKVDINAEKAVHDSGVEILFSGNPDHVISIFSFLQLVIHAWLGIIKIIGIILLLIALYGLSCSIVLLLNVIRVLVIYLILVFLFVLFLLLLLDFNLKFIFVLIFLKSISFSILFTIQLIFFSCSHYGWILSWYLIVHLLFFNHIGCSVFKMNLV